MAASSPPTDVKYTLERLVDPATQSPGQGYYAVIEGFDEMVAGEATAFPASPRRTTIPW